MTEAHVWLEAWLAIVSSGRAGRTQAANEWADACVEAYRRRFTATRNQSPNPPAKTGKPAKR
jgi:hypothetical protein